MTDRSAEGGEHKIVEKRRVLTIISAAFIATPVILVIVAFIIIPGVHAEALPDSQGQAGLDLMLAALASLALMLSVPLPRFLLRQNIPGGEGSSDKMSRLFAAYIVSLAVRESGVIIGFVLSFLSNDPTWVVTFGVLTVLFGLWQWPTTSFVERLLKD